MGIQGRGDQALGSGLAQGKSFLLNKFSSLNQKVKQSNVNIGNFKPLGRLGTFSKPEVKVNFLKPNMKVNLWKSDSSLETTDSNPGSVAMKDLCDNHSDLEISSDSDSYNSADEQPLHGGSLENADYVLPSCGIVASAPRLGSRSQSVSSVEIAVPTVVHGTNADDYSQGDGPSPEAAQEAILIDFGTPIDVYCHQFAQDAQTKPVVEGQVEQPALSQNLSAKAPPSSTEPQPGAQPQPQPPQEQQVKEEPQLSRPSQLNVQPSAAAPPSSNLLSVQAPGSGSAVSGGSQRSLGSQLEGSLGPSPADSNGSRVVSPFAKIKSSMVQVASLTQAGLTQGINFAVAKVQKSPEPEAVNEVQENELKAMFTQCQTRIIQI